MIYSLAQTLRLASVKSDDMFQKETIKIAYDGSSFSEAALDDLVRAKLPETGEFLVMSIAEIWLAQRESKSRQSLAEVETLANHAAARLREMFPRWTISTDVNFGSPARKVLEKADGFKPDLIIAGSHGHSAVGRFMLGSVSQKILTEANCSVRIARGRIELDPISSRIVVFDDSEGANFNREIDCCRDF